MGKISKSYLKELAKNKYKSGGFSTQGYKRNSPDVNNPYNVIPSNQITMKGVDFPVMGTDNMGYQQMMYPGQDYTFPGEYVTEFPLKNMGNKRYGQQGLKKKNLIIDPKTKKLNPDVFNRLQDSITQKEILAQSKPEGAKALPEIQITAERPGLGSRIKNAVRPYVAPEGGFLDQWRQRIVDETGGADWYKQPNSVLGAFSSVVTSPLQAPQYGAVYKATGKVQTPSEALNIQNPVGAFLTDVALDPMTYVGMGVSKIPQKVGKSAVPALKGAGKYLTTQTPLKNAFKQPLGSGNFGNYQNILDKGLDIHDVRLKYHNNMILDFDEADMVSKFGKGNKTNYERALVEDIAGKMHTDDVSPKIEDISKKNILDHFIGTEQPKVAIPDKSVKPLQTDKSINPVNFEQEQNIIKPPKFELPSFYSDPYQRTSTSRAADKWLEDWFYNPQTKQKFINYGGTEGEWQGVLNSLENPIKSNYTWGKNQPGGVYMRVFDQASMPLDATVDVGVHEGIHKAKLLLDKQNPVLHKLWNDFTDAVRLTPSEAYPEIFRFRQKLGLKPGQTIDLKTMEDNLHLISDGYSLPYKVKDKSKLLEIINKAPAIVPPAAIIGAGALQQNQKPKGTYQLGGRSLGEFGKKNVQDNTVVNNPKFVKPTPKYNLFPDKSFDGLDAAAKVADVVTDVMQIGNFIPFPPAQIIGKVGNWLGAGVDAYQGARSAYKGDYGDMALNFGSALLPSYLSRKGYERPISAVSNSYSGATKYRALNYLSGNNAAQRAALSPFINANRRVAGALVGETAYDANLINGNNYNTVPGGFRDNTNVNQVIIESPKYTGPVLKQGQKLMPVEFGSYKMQMGGTMGIPGVNGQVVSSGPQPLTSVKKTRGPITKNKKGDIKTMSNQQVKQVLKYSKQKPNKI